MGLAGAFFKNSSKIMLLFHFFVIVYMREKLLTRDNKKEK